MLPRLNDVPLPARALGLAGLIPFVACAAAVWTTVPLMQIEGTRLLMGYSAVILTFLGGVHWGKALADRPVLNGEIDGDLNWLRLGWSVTPSLVAWIALLMSPVAALILFMAAFVAAFLVDRQAVRIGFFPEWYLPLRKVLTLGVLACLIATLIRFRIEAGV